MRSLPTPSSRSFAPVLAVPMPLWSFSAPSATFPAPVFSSLIFLTASSRSSERFGARSARAWACFSRAARFLSSFFSSFSRSVTRPLTSSATVATVAAASRAFSRSGQAASGSAGSAQRVRYTPASASAWVRASSAAAGAFFTRESRFSRSAPDESATNRAVSPMVFSLSSRKGPTRSAAPLTLPASFSVPSATRFEPFSRSPAFVSSFFSPSDRSPLPSSASLSPSARSLEPFSALPTPPLISSAPFAAFTVSPWMSEKETKIRSRNARDALPDAASRTSAKTVREICPTM